MSYGFSGWTEMMNWNTRGFAHVGTSDVDGTDETGADAGGNVGIIPDDGLDAGGTPFTDPPEGGKDAGGSPLDPVLGGEDPNTPSNTLTDGGAASSTTGNTAAQPTEEVPPGGGGDGEPLTWTAAFGSVTQTDNSITGPTGDYAEANLDNDLGPLVPGSVRPQYFRFSGTATFNNITNYNDQLWIRLDQPNELNWTVEIYPYGMLGDGSEGDWTVNSYAPDSPGYEFFTKDPIPSTFPFVITAEDGVGYNINLNNGQIDWTLSYNDTFLTADPLNIRVLLESNGAGVELTDLVLDTTP